MKILKKITGLGLTMFLLAGLFPIAEAGKAEKVDVCHKGKTINVSLNALSAHLAHGDFEGACDEDEEPEPPLPT